MPNIWDASAIELQPPGLNDVLGYQWRRLGCRAWSILSGTISFRQREPGKAPERRGGVPGNRFIVGR